MTGLVRAMALRRLVVAFLALALGLSGIGRVVAMPLAGQPAAVVIGGIVVDICQGGQDADQDGKAIGHHGCDQCSLGAAVALPTPPAVGTSARFGTILADPRPVEATGPIAAGWSPRQPTGPPAA